MTIERRGGSGRAMAFALLCVVAACTDTGDDTRSGTGSSTGESTGDDIASSTGAPLPSSTSTSPAPPPDEVAPDPRSTAPPASASVAPVRCDAAAAADSAAPRTLTVWHQLSGDATDVVARLVQRFEAERGEVLVNVVAVPGFEDARERLLAAGPDELPDLFMAPVDAVRALADSGRFVPPPHCTRGTLPATFDDVVPIVAASYSVDGVLQAVPFNVSTPVLLYDRARFRAAGLDPDDPPTTAVALRAAVEQLVITGQGPRGLLVYDRSASWFVEQWAARTGRVLVEPANGHGPRPSELQPVFTHPDAVEALAWLRAMVDDGLVSSVGLNTSDLDDLLAMVDPEAPGAATLHTSAAIGDLSRLLREPSNPFPGAELGVGPLPGPGVGSLVGGAGFWIVDRGDAVQAGTAWLLAEWLADAPQQADLSEATGYVPVTSAAVGDPDLAAHWREFPEFEVPYRQLLAAGDAPAHTGMQVGPRMEIQRLLELAAMSVVVSGADPLTALQDAEQAAERLLRLYTDQSPTG